MGSSVVRRESLAIIVAKQDNNQLLGYSIKLTYFDPSDFVLETIAGIQPVPRQLTAS